MLVMNSEPGNPVIVAHIWPSCSPIVISQACPSKSASLWRFENRTTLWLSEPHNGFLMVTNPGLNRPITAKSILFSIAAHNSGSPSIKRVPVWSIVWNRPARNSGRVYPANKPMEKPGRTRLKKSAIASTSNECCNGSPPDRVNPVTSAGKFINHV